MSGTIVDVIGSPEASSRNDTIDISATRRLYGRVWWALRLIYGIAFAVFVGIYCLLIVKSSIALYGTLM